MAFLSSNGGFLDASKGGGFMSYPAAEEAAAGLADYGDGSGGVTTYSGNATLTKDTFLADGSVVNGGVTVNTAGFRMFARGTFTNNGIIEHNGNDAAGATGGAISNAGTLKVQGKAGKNGGTGNGVAGSGDTVIAGVGDGGAGGDSGGNTGGAGGNNTSSAYEGHVRSMPFAAVIHQMSNSAFTQFYGGASGGSGAGDGTNNGGGSGGGAGAVMIAAENMVNNGVIRCAGGAGADGVAGNAAGGGGASGGICLLVTNKLTGNEPTAPGGAGGDGVSTGTNGAAGDSGFALTVLNA